jgi:hypothetical protein
MFCLSRPPPWLLSLRLQDWLHKASELPKEEFKREVEKHLNGQETEPWEIIYFKVYKSQLRVIEQALETFGATADLFGIESCIDNFALQLMWSRVQNLVQQRFGATISFATHHQSRVDDNTSQPSRE